MATITFVNTDLTKLNGLGFNPGLEEFLDPKGEVSAFSASLFEITNKSGGPLNGFEVQFYSSVGNFTYNGGSSVPTGGKIDGITVKAPDGTIIMTVVPGTNGFGDQDLVDFYNRLFDANSKPDEAVFYALNQLLSTTDTINGSAIADHMTNFGYSDDVAMFGGGGDDVLWNQTADNYNNDAILVGQAGNDVFRVEQGDVQVHGAEQNGAGGEGETDILEVFAKVGGNADVDVELVTDIDVLRFAVSGAPVNDDDDINMTIEFDASQIGAGLLSPTLSVEGSTTPFSDMQIYISTDNSASNTTPVLVDLSGWTFTNWSSDEDDDSDVSINTNSNAVANDVVVGTMVSDSINTYDGDDVLRGGGGGDYLSGGQGSDTFVYGANEAGKYESVYGGYDDDPGIDTVLFIGDNDFTKGSIYGVEQIVFQGAATASFNQWSLGYDENYLEPSSMRIVGDGNANGLAFMMLKGSEGSYSPMIDLSELQFQSWTGGQDVVSIRGTNIKDLISGSTQNDVIAGGRGSDDLQGNEGGDAFLFDFAPGKGVDHIADFSRGEGDMIQLDNAVFGKMKDGKLKKSAFATGDEAGDKGDRLIYDKKTGVLSYDDDGSGKHDATIIAVLENGASLKAADIFVI